MRLYLTIISFAMMVGFMKVSKTMQIHPEGMILTKALCQLAKFYALTGKEISQIIGISESTASRLMQGKKFISPDTKEGEMALLLIRIYRSLNAMVGNNHDKARRWLNSQNLYFNHKPIDEMKTIPGLIGVLNYLDAMRGKL
jgi:hypothetical protein